MNGSTSIKVDTTIEYGNFDHAWKAREYPPMDKGPVIINANTKKLACPKCGKLVEVLFDDTEDRIICLVDEDL